MKKLWIITTLAAIFIACPNGNSGFNFEEFLAEFQYRKAAWESLGIDYYRYTVMHGGVGGAPPWRLLLNITVFPDREPEITEINRKPIADATAEEVEALDALIEILDHMQYTPLTITQFFSGLIWSMTTPGGTGLLHHELPFFGEYVVVYNEDYHFPEHFSVRHTESIGGGFGSAKITSFEDLRER
jgi:hypothetical protein